MSFDITYVPQPEHWDHNRLSTTIKMKPGQPLDPIAYAKMIQNVVKTLESLDKNSSPDGKKRYEWCLIEAAVIGDQGTFTLQGYPKSQIDALKKGFPPDELFTEAGAP